MREAAKDWPAILQFETGATITEVEVEKHYRLVAKKAHPDAGGSNEAMTQVNLAKQLALAWIAKERDRVAERERAEHCRTVNQQFNAATQQQYANQFNPLANSLGGLGNYAAGGQPKASWVRDFFRSSK